MPRSPRLDRPLIAALALAAACTGAPREATHPGAVAATYAESGRWVEAAREIEIALRRHPADPELLLQAAAIYEQLGASTQAAAALEAATRSAPRDPAVWAAWAAFEERRGRVDSAYVAWRRAYALAPTDPAVAASFGRAAERAGLDADAELRRAAPAERAP